MRKRASFRLFFVSQHKRRCPLTVIAIVQLPPPVTGLSAVNQSMVDVLAQSGKLKAVVDVAPPAGATGLRKHLARLVLTARAATALVTRRNGLTTLYMPSDGGAGMIWNITLVWVARLLGYKLWVHHHSFAYINRRSVLMWLQLWSAPYGARHIVNCDVMLEKLASQYQGVWSRRGHSAVVVNNAFMSQLQVDSAPRSGSLVIGHLANLTVEKGAVRFVDLFRAARSEGLDLRARIAGPVGDAATQQAIEAAIRDYGEEFQWLGPVYGVEKAGFYASIDAFVFPSDYANEAQPLVLLEALAGGAAVLATDRGCMACDHGDSPGIIAASAEFHDRALAWLRETVAIDRQSLPLSAAEAYGAMQVNARRQMSGVIAEI